MHVYSMSPQGVLTHLDLGATPVHRLELGAAGPQFGIGIRYVAGGVTSLVFLAAIDTGTSGNECKGIAKAGLPKNGPAANKERLTESAKILHNADGLQPRKVDELIAEAPKLVDVYYDALKALTTGAEVRGSTCGWKWAIQKEAIPVEWPSDSPAGEQPPQDNAGNHG